MAPPRRASPNSRATGVPSGPVVLVGGADEFQVKTRARQIQAAWSAQTGGTDDETIPGEAGAADQVLAVLRRVREALQSLPFFGGSKLVWLRDVNWLGDDARLSSTAAVTQAVKEWEAELKAFSWEGVRLLISAGKVDGRRSFPKTIRQIGQLELYESLADASDWAEQAAALVNARLREAGKHLPEPVLQQLVDWVGPDRRALASEIDKLILYTEDRRELTSADVEAIISRGRRAEAFALADAVGQRNLPLALQRLDEELWSLRQAGSDKSVVGLLMTLAGQLRLTLLVKEAVRRRLLPGRATYAQVKAALARLPADLLPQGDPYNLGRIHPFRIFKALEYAQRYSLEELREGLRVLREALRRLMSGQLDQNLLVESTLLRIIGPGPSHLPAASPAANRPRRR